MVQVHDGRCNCGAVRFRAKGELEDLIGCHCSQCRRQTGLYYAATNVEKDRLEIEGADNVTWYRSSEAARRGFCRTCGSALFWEADGADYVSVMAGALDQPTGLRFGYHIYCADKADYYDIADSAPRFSVGSASASTGD